MERVEYIWHDCFVVELASVTMVFDYWSDVNGESREFPEFLDRIPVDKPLLVFVSHSHKDHYNPAIFAWSTRFEEVHYFLSRDVWKRARYMFSASSVYKGVKVEEQCVSGLMRGESAEAYGVKVTAMPSTDVGVSWVVEAEGLRLFHAGDLNAWIWLDESTEEEVKKAMGDYRACLREIAKVAGKEGRFDYCFFPVDSRIGREYWRGASIFVREFDVRRFFPMHFGLGDEEERRRRRRDAFAFGEYANRERGEYIPLGIPGTGYWRC